MCVTNTKRTFYSSDSGYKMMNQPMLTLIKEKKACNCSDKIDKKQNNRAQKVLLI